MIRAYIRLGIVCYVLLIVIIAVFDFFYLAELNPLLIIGVPTVILGAPWMRGYNLIKHWTNND